MTSRPRISLISSSTELKAEKLKSQSSDSITLDCRWPFYLATKSFPSPVLTLISEARNTCHGRFVRSPHHTRGDLRRAGRVFRHLRLGAIMPMQEKLLFIKWIKMDIRLMTLGVRRAKMLIVPLQTAKAERISFPLALYRLASRPRRSP
jgi:hypothetical protein